MLIYTHYLINTFMCKALYVLEALLLKAKDELNKSFCPHPVDICERRQTVSKETTTFLR